MLNGSYKLLYIKYLSVWLPIGCLTENSFSEGVDMINTTTRDNENGWSSSIPVTQSYSISFSGILTIDDLGGTIIDYSDLKEIKRSRLKIEWKIYSSEGGDTESGFGYITSLSDSASIDEFVSFDGEIIGSGPPTTTAGIPVIGVPNSPIDLTLTEGDFTPGGVQAPINLTLTEGTI